MLSFQMNHVRKRETERDSSNFFKVWFKCISLSWSLSLVTYAKELTTSSCMKRPAKINPGWRKRCHDLSNSDFKWDLESIVFTLKDASTSKGCRTSQSVIDDTSLTELMYSMTLHSAQHLSKNHVIRYEIQSPKFGNNR